jgi:hypothetical protein
MSISVKEIIIMGSDGLNTILDHPVFDSLLLLASTCHM